MCYTILRYNTQTLLSLLYIYHSFFLATISLTLPYTTTSTTRHKLLWVRRKDKDDYWCAGAYIINKAVWKPYIDRIFTPIHTTTTSTPTTTTTSSTTTPLHATTTTATQWYGVHLIAGYEKPHCTPALCCEQSIFQHTNPICVKSARGYAADNYLFNIPYNQAYMLTVPIVTGGIYGNHSTLHQDHVSYHISAFHRINQYIDTMIRGTSPLPAFMNKHCRFNSTSIQ